MLQLWSPIFSRNRIRSTKIYTRTDVGLPPLSFVSRLCGFIGWTEPKGITYRERKVINVHLILPQLENILCTSASYCSQLQHSERPNNHLGLQQTEQTSRDSSFELWMEFERCITRVPKLIPPCAEGRAYVFELNYWHPYLYTQHISRRGCDRWCTWNCKEVQPVRPRNVLYFTKAAEWNFKTPK